MFAGQGGSSWRDVLNDACLDGEVRALVDDLRARADTIVEPIAPDMLPVVAGGDNDDSRLASDAAVSVPGITIAQAAELAYFGKTTGPLFSRHLPNAYLGHSQGVIAVHLAKAYLSHDIDQAARWYAIARIIGTAASLRSRSLGITRSQQATPMLSVKGIAASQAGRIASRILHADIAPAVVNAYDHVAFSGMPATMSRLARGLQHYASARPTGSTAAAPIVEFLSVGAPFHCALLAPAVEQSVLWARQCGLDEDATRQIAQLMLITPDDWHSRINKALDDGIRWFIDLGPGNVLGDITRSIVSGSGAGVISAGEPRLCDEIGMPGFECKASDDWSAYAPELISLPDGRTVLDTAFTRLTGRSAIMLGGMTPTTVDPAIVAAAANAGHWAELAGGGQTSKTLFFDRMRQLHEQLNPGVAVQFNTMMMNPTLWNLQFANTDIVGKARRAGAPLDGVTLSAGLPDPAEAGALFDRLHKDGFAYIALKVGSIEQIRHAVAIAREHPKTTLILQVEDGRGGGHHSWQSLDDMLLAQYANIRHLRNLVLAVGGGFGTPNKAARYLTGDWSRRYGLRAMPVDAVFVGTVAMTCREALTNPDVKQALVDAAGILESNETRETSAAHNPDTTHEASPADTGWIRRNTAQGGVASGVSALHADLYELDNSAARCNRLLNEITHSDDIDKAVEEHRNEIIAALDATAKPYFGDVTDMSYADWLRRYAALSYPWVDASWSERFVSMIERCEQRLTATDHGEFTPLIDTDAAAHDPLDAIGLLVQRYPAASSVRVCETDAAWFVELCDKPGTKPVPFVPVIDSQVTHRWGQDAMWQSQDRRYTADQVLALPGPLSVAHVERVDEPVGELLDRFETACVTELESRGVQPTAAWSRLADAITGRPVTTPERLACSSPLIERCGHLTANTAAANATNATNVANAANADAQHSTASRSGSPTPVECRPVEGRAHTYEMITHLDNTFWDAHKQGSSAHVTREMRLPLRVTESTTNGGYPIVDETLLRDDMIALLADMAGVGTSDVCGNRIAALPQTVPSKRSAFGEHHARLHINDMLGAMHATVTGTAQLSDHLHPASAIPDALMCLLWPLIYSSISNGSTDGTPWIYSLQSMIHLSHEVRFTHDGGIAHLLERYRGMSADGENPYLDAVAWADPAIDSVNGRVLGGHIEIHLRAADEQTNEDEQGNEADSTAPTDATATTDDVVAVLTERFIIPTHVYADDSAPLSMPYGGVLEAEHRSATATRRRLLRHAIITAPTDMNAFERVSGDYNPLHVSRTNARMVGYDKPIVNGMWLSAAAQQLVCSLNDEDESRYRIEGWTYSMFVPVPLGAHVDISVERAGRTSRGRLLLDVTCRVGDGIVARATAVVEAPVTAYVFPGQGSQRKGMGMNDLSQSAAVREVWDRADRHTRDRFGFSILTIVRDNPESIVVQGVEYRHPKGVLFLSQFTQVALTVLGFAQYAKFDSENVTDDANAYIAGHSLGEYTALSVVGNAFSLETVIDMVYQRGNTMYELVERDEQGRSNYGMGALRPIQFGVDDDAVDDYVNDVSKRCGEFLQIVNYNVAGSQYAVVGTLKGLRFLKSDAEQRAREFGGKPPYMPIPGIDVPFHSRMMRPGVAKYRERLESLIPQDDDPRGLIGHYIPNLVARPFALTRDFAESILAVAPSTRIQEALASEESWAWWQQHPQKLARMLLIELLAWQFASPVRWIETQRLLFTPRERGGLGVERFVEVGLAATPVLANMAAKTLKQPEFEDAHVQVLNAERDADRVLGNDTDPAPGTQVDASDAGTRNAVADADAAAAVNDDAESDAADVASASVQSQPVQSQPTQPQSAQSKPTKGASQSRHASTAAAIATATTATTQAAAQSTPAAQLRFTATDAVRMLLALENKIRLDQIGSSDTLETLTNGVSSKRNQQLVDIAAEISVPSLDGAAEATMSKLADMVDHAAGGYKPFGSVLDKAVKSRIHELFGVARIPQSHVAQRLDQHWNLGGDWVYWTLAQLLIGTREGTSLRGDALRTLPNVTVKTRADADRLIDAAINAVAASHHIAISPVVDAAQGGAAVDSKALDAFKATVTGPDGILAATARDVLQRLGIAPAPDSAADGGESEAAANERVVALVERELGSDWAQSVRPAFDARKAVLFDDRWASAREDLARLYLSGSLPTDPMFGGEASFVGLGRAVGAQAAWWADKCDAEGKADLARRFRGIAQDAEADEETIARRLPYHGKVALITGATPHSIAGAVTSRFLAGGATVIITASHIDWRREQFARDVYRRHAAGDARLWLVPANLAAYGDVDALIAWVTAESRRTVGASSILLKPALMPDFFFPFAAPRVSGTLDQVGPNAERQMRLLLWSVERGIADLTRARQDVDVTHRTLVVLPGSGNRGVFGGDGAYGEAKNAFDAIERKWRSEPGWHDRILLAQPTIGWVRGTGLMAHNDPLVAAVEAKGVRTYSTGEIADELMKLCTPSSIEAATHAPVHANLTGGVGEVDVDLAQVGSEFIAEFRRQQAQERERAARESAGAAQNAPRTLKALPSIAAASPDAAASTDVSADAIRREVLTAEQWGDVRTDLDNMAVIVGVGLIGPWGSGRTAVEAELGIRYDGTADMTANGVIELAWSMHLITWQDAPHPGWMDVRSGELIDEADIYDRYHDEVVARCGIRELEDDGEIAPDGDEIIPSVYLNEDVSFNVPDREQAEAYKAADTQNTVIAPNGQTGEWTVTRKAGSQVRVPRRRALLRHVGAQIPKGFDPAVWGLPASMLESLDEVSLWSMFTTVDAFLASGFTPSEILRAIHPADFASTQSTGIGGARSSLTMFQEYVAGHDIAPDLFAEVMPNIIGGHVMQSYLGGYGEINTPIGACATAAVSLEEGIDKILLHKADFVVTGGSDDMSQGSVFGFGNMNATADDAMLHKEGIGTRFMSRPDDRRRAGFIEAQGGGTVLVARASLALRLGLPVLGVVGYARTFADGAHASIPAPGLGALAAGRGGRRSALARQLADLGLTADDITVVCKHDTSTNANDANESEIHHRLARAIGRTAGNPLYVFSPKAITGHAKGGSFVFQTSDIMHMFHSGKVPANMSLDCVDPSMRTHDELVWVRNAPLDLASAGITVKSVIASSLGFGHVSSVAVFVNPIAFEAAVLSGADTPQEGRELLERWLTRSRTRLAAGMRRLDAGMHGHAALFEPIEHRHFDPSDDVHDVEAAMLLDDDARLGEDGRYLSGTRDTHDTRGTHDTREEGTASAPRS